MTKNCFSLSLLFFDTISLMQLKYRERFDALCALHYRNATFVPRISLIITFEFIKNDRSAHVLQRRIFRCIFYADRANVVPVYSTFRSCFPRILRAYTQVCACEYTRTSEASERASERTRARAASATGVMLVYECTCMRVS